MQAAERADFGDAPKFRARHRMLPRLLVASGFAIAGAVFLGAGTASADEGSNAQDQDRAGGLVSSLTESAAESLDAVADLPESLVDEDPLIDTDIAEDTETAEEPAATTETDSARADGTAELNADVEPLESTRPGPTDNVVVVLDPLVDVVEQSTQIVNPVAKTVLVTVAPVIEPVAPVVDPVVDAVDPVIQIAEPVAQIVEPGVPVAGSPEQTIEPSAPTADEPETQVAGPVVGSEPSAAFLGSVPAALHYSLDASLDDQPSPTDSREVPRPSTLPSPLVGQTGLPGGAPGAVTSVDQTGSASHALLPEEAVQRARFISAAAYAWRVDGLSQREATNPPVSPD